MKYKSIFTLSIIFIVFSVFGIFYFKNAGSFHFRPSCPFYLFTGLYCPGCGSMRALTAIFNGNFGEALHFNIITVASIPLMIYFLVIKLFVLITKKQIPAINIYSGFIIKTVLLVTGSFFILRNIPFYPFNLLAPNAG